MIKAAMYGVIKNKKTDINPLYYEHIRRSGVETYDVFPESPEKAAAEFDCLIVCGGGDTDPRLYGQSPYRDNERYETELDIYELELIRKFISSCKPVLGICKGMQSLNIALGGTLIQDIPSMLGLCHSGSQDKVCMHEIKISKNSKLSAALGKRAVVNSYHHQCVHTIGQGLIVAAASHDGVIEATEGDSFPALGVQWHPERMTGNAVFDHFFSKYL